MREGGVPLLVTTIPIAIGIAIYYLVQNRQEQQQNHKTSIPRQLKGSLYENELKIAIGLALQTGHNIKEALNKYKSIDKKGDGEIDFVTATDKENERIIFTELQKHFPTHKFIGEVLI